MSKRIVIHESVESNEDLADLLRRLADMVEEGYTSGYYPAWEIEEDD